MHPIHAALLAASVLSVQAQRPGRITTTVAVRRPAAVFTPPAVGRPPAAVVTTSSSSSTSTSTSSTSSSSTKPLTTSTTASTSTVRPTTSSSTVRPTTTSTLSTSVLPTTTSTTIAPTTTSTSTSSVAPSTTKVPTSSSSNIAPTTTKAPTTTSTSSTVVPTTTAIIAAAIPDASSNTCFADNGAFTGPSFYHDTLMTPGNCATWCTDRGYAVGGTVFGNRCYCSHVMPTVASASCTIGCSGDNNQKCGSPGGGALAFNVVNRPFSTVPTINTKRGLDWPWDNKAVSFNAFDPARVTWLYNWEMWDPRGAGVYVGAEYMGLCRTKNNIYQIPWYYNDNKRFSQYLMGFNEPDLQGSDTVLGVAEAVQLWRDHFLPIRAKYGTTLVSPAMTNAVAPGWGIDWMNQFVAACGNDCFQILALHWYGYTPTDFIAHFNSWHAAYPQYPIWITEFAFTDHDVTSTENLSRMAMAWMDAQPWITRYSLFGPMGPARMVGIVNSAMMTPDETALSRLGQIYMGQV